MPVAARLPAMRPASSMRQPASETLPVPVTRQAAAALTTRVDEYHVCTMTGLLPGMVCRPGMDKRNFRLLAEFILSKAEGLGVIN